jgi:hypothetical protein
VPSRPQKAPRSATSLTAAGAIASAQSLVIVVAVAAGASGRRLDNRVRHQDAPAPPSRQPSALTTVGAKWQDESTT